LPAQPHLPFLRPADRLGKGDVDKNGLNAWCKVTVLRLKNCRHCGARAIANFLSTSLVELDLEGNNIHVHPLAKAKTKASSSDIYNNEVIVMY
jgi:hypothetical protein